jgi:hypothetical protein
MAYFIIYFKILIIIYLHLIIKTLFIGYLINNLQIRLK